MFVFKRKGISRCSRLFRLLVQRSVALVRGRYPLPNMRSNGSELWLATTLRYYLNSGARLSPSQDCGWTASFRSEDWLCWYTVGLLVSYLVWYMMCFICFQNKSLSVDNRICTPAFSMSLTNVAAAFSKPGTGDAQSWSKQILEVSSLGQCSTISRNV